MFSGYYALFALNMVMNHLNYKEHGQKLKVDYVKIAIFNAIMLSSQAYFNGGMMTGYVIHNRLAIMNQFIKKSADTELQMKNELLKVLKTASVFMDKMCDIMESIKRTSSASLVFFLLQEVYFTVLSIYSFVAYVFNEDAHEVDRILFVSSVNWCFYFFTFNLFIFYYSHKIKQEGHRFEAIIDQFSYKTNLKEIHQKIQLIHLQMKHRRPIIQCGVFAIDPKLAFELMAMVFSYMIIILQFDMKYYQ